MKAQFCSRLQAQLLVAMAFPGIVGPRGVPRSGIMVFCTRACVIFEYAL